ncbi:MAG TPA: PepSY domain-containing protein [Steroidobacteraceae bacterium]|nr:PepSY domain-containing protein [Steroidobacteraceae bacterium]
MNLQRLIGLALLVAGAGAAGASSEAPPSAPPANPAPPVIVLTAASLSMDQAVRLAEQHFHARVVKAETERENGHTVYVLRLLSDAGRVWTVRVDAASGALL